MISATDIALSSVLLYFLFAGGKFFEFFCQSCCRHLTIPNFVSFRMMQGRVTVDPVWLLTTVLFFDMKTTSCPVCWWRWVTGFCSFWLLVPWKFTGNTGKGNVPLSEMNKGWVSSIIRLALWTPPLGQTGLPDNRILLNSSWDESQ